MLYPRGGSAHAARALSRCPERERRGALARPEVCERFSWTTIAAQLGDVFEEVAATPVEAVIGD
jgi:glycosyltransferase involved in cell wall biosynthesis